MKVFVVPNFLKEETETILKNLIVACEKYNVTIEYIAKEDSLKSFVIGTSSGYITPKIPEAYMAKFIDSDVIVSIGGDGTIMHCARIGAVYEKPVMGINAGNLGFLAQVETADLDECVAKLSAGQYHMDYRSAIAAEFGCDEYCKVEFALNDIIISKTFDYNLVRMETRCDDHFIDHYRADGLIFSTATGSTAYNLSAGGPIIDPLLDVITMVPICPHSINTRPLVFDKSRRITVVSKDCPLMVSADGRRRYTVMPGTTITINTSSMQVGFITFDKKEFFEVLTKKIKQRG